MLRKYLNKMNHIFGNPNSKIIMEVYEDYESEECSKAFRELKALREYFKEEMCLIYRHFPIVRMHPSSFLAAQIVESCGLQQKYLQAHDLMLECQEYLEYGLGGIIRILKSDYSVSEQKLNDDLKEGIISRKINNDIKNGIQLGITDTPAIYINGLMYEGAVKFDSIATFLKEKMYELKMNAARDKNEDKRSWSLGLSYFS